MTMKGNVDAVIGANIHQNLFIPWLMSRYADSWPEDAFEKEKFRGALICLTGGSLGSVSTYRSGQPQRLLIGHAIVY